MATTWIPMTRMEPRKWLLANGETITEPALEMTASGRKIRVAGTTDSVYAGELESLLDRASRTLAAQRGTSVWMTAYDNMFDLNMRQASIKPGAARLHVVHDPTDRSAKTTCWWRFKDPNSSYEVLLYATMSPRGDGIAQTVHISLAFPTPLQGNASNVQVTFITDDAFSQYPSYADRNLYYEWQEHLRDNPPTWPQGHLGIRNFGFARPGIQHLLKAVRAFEDLESIQVPNSANHTKPEYLTLELYDTNVNAEFINDLTEYLDGAPSIEKVAELYNEMLATMRSAGIHVAAKSENDFMAALLAGDKEVLGMAVQNLAAEGEGTDRSHRLAVHLPSGTFIVECDHREVDRNQVAEKWEEAMTMASLTGQEDDLLAYAKAYAADRIKKRTSQILEERV